MARNHMEVGNNLKKRVRIVSSKPVTGSESIFNEWKMLGRSPFIQGYKALLNDLLLSASIQKSLLEEAIENIQCKREAQWRKKNKGNDRFEKACWRIETIFDELKYSINLFPRIWNALHNNLAVSATIWQSGQQTHISNSIIKNIRNAVNEWDYSFEKACQGHETALNELNSTLAVRDWTSTLQRHFKNLRQHKQ